MTNDEKAARFDFLVRVLRVYNDFGGPPTSCLWWRTDGEFAPLKLFANCNDLFYRATADAEEITTENIAELEGAYADLLAIDPKLGDEADTLFCCRVRKMRPQKPYYKHIDERLWPLLDACGPERTDA